MNQNKIEERYNHLRELISQYWDIAWREGNSGRCYDTEEGSAQNCINEIETVLSEIKAAQNEEVVTELTESDYDEIVEEASHNLRRYCSSPRGQILTPSDGLEWHVMKATERYLRDIQTYRSTYE